jgi:hypothetical protein
MAEEKKDQSQSMADSVKSDAEKFVESIVKQQVDASKAIEGLAGLGEQTRKIIEDFVRQDASIKATMLEALGLDVGKASSLIAESMKQLQEVLSLAKEGKLGAYSDDTPIPELMRRMARLKEAQKKALETGQVDLAAANEWLINRWPEHRPCPLCNHEEWGFGPSFVQLPTSTLGLRSPPRTNPCVAVVCGHCGNTILLNAIIMGLIPKENG